ncbi:MAG: coenzyme F420-0:L-glutamate ligase [Candidatus Bathyarchaeia archaeon]
MIGLRGIPLVKPGDDLAQLIVEAAARSKVPIEDGDVIVVAQKVVSKAENRLVALADVKPSPFAENIALAEGKDARQVELVLRESRRAVKIRDGHLIMETKHGFVCANAGVDLSNVSGGEVASLLPEDPDRSAARIMEGVKRLIGVDVGVIISDTFGRAWRMGQVDVAVGVAGVQPFRDYRGQNDMFGYVLKVTSIAVVDELAAAAELVMGKADGIPVAIVKGSPAMLGPGSAKDLVRPVEKDLFR